MKITQIISETTAGCVATVAMPMGETQKRPKVSGLEPAEKVMFGKSKKKGPYGNSLSEGKMKDLTMDLRASKDGLSDIEFKKKYGKTKEEMRKSMQDARKEQKVNEAELSEQDLIVIPGQGRKLKTGFVPHGKSRIDHEVEMARSDLFSAAQNAQKVYSMIKDMSEEEGLEGWVQEKIIKANDYLNTIREYLEGKQVQGVTENNQRVDSLVTDALRIMKGAEVSDAVRALKTVLGDREYNGRRGHYNFYVRQLMDMYSQQGVAEGVADMHSDKLLNTVRDAIRKAIKETGDQSLSKIFVCLRSAIPASEALKNITSPISLEAVDNALQEVGIDFDDLLNFINKQAEKYGKQGIAEGAKVDRMVKHIEKSEEKSGKSKKEAENIAWATANKRGMLNNKNKKA